jgi:hypothetical protein
MKTLTAIQKEKEIHEYLDMQPFYVQPFLTDCIILTDNIFQAADKFDDEVIKWLEAYQPEKVEEYKKEWRD